MDRVAYRADEPSRVRAHERLLCDWCGASSTLEPVLGGVFACTDDSACMARESELKKINQKQIAVGAGAGESGTIPDDEPAPVTPAIAQGVVFG